MTVADLLRALLFILAWVGLLVFWPLTGFWLILAFFGDAGLFGLALGLVCGVVSYGFFALFDWCIS